MIHRGDGRYDIKKSRKAESHCCGGSALSSIRRGGSVKKMHRAIARARLSRGRRYIDG